MKPMDLTKGRVEAFFEVMFDWEAVGEQQGRPVSPMVLAHFKAIFGTDKVPSTAEIRRSWDKIESWNKINVEEARRTIDLYCEYFEAVVKVLREGRET